MASLFLNCPPKDSEELNNMLDNYSILGHLTWEYVHRATSNWRVATFTSEHGLWLFTKEMNKRDLNPQVRF